MLFYCLQRLGFGFQSRWINYSLFIPLWYQIVISQALSYHLSPLLFYFFFNLRRKVSINVDLPFHLSAPSPSECSIQAGGLKGSKCDAAGWGGQWFWRVSHQGFNSTETSRSRRSVKDLHFFALNKNGLTSASPFFICLMQTEIVLNATLLTGVTGGLQISRVPQQQTAGVVGHTIQVCKPDISRISGNIDEVRGCCVLTYWSWH